jgi:hypothetical protein
MQTSGRRHLAKAAALGGMWLAMRPGMASAQTNSGTWLDVREFGAKGDGHADDTKPIQNAIDQAAERGGAVFVSPGVYASGELQLRPRVALIGVPAWDYHGGGGSVLRLIDPNASCLVNITNAFGATIEGLSLDGRKLGKSIHGVFLNKPDYGKQEDTFRIERSQIANFSGDGVRLTRAWCFSIRHSMIAYNAGDGIRLRGWDGFLMDNWFSGNAGAGFGAREENASCTFTGNRIEWNREGLIIIGGDGYNITGNFFDRAGTCGLLVERSEQMTISGNFMRRSGKNAKPDTYDSAQIRFESVRGVTCSANNLQVGRDDNGRGVWSPSYGIVYKQLQNTVISNNVLHEGAMKELLLDLGGHGEGAVVKDNPGSLFNRSQ